jgi:bifunctional DNase/RNase
VDYGTAIAIAVPSSALCVSVASVIITAIKTKATTADVHTVEDGRTVSVDSRSSGLFGLNARCADHSGIEESLKNLADGQKRIEETQKEMFKLMREDGKR